MHRHCRRHCRTRHAARRTAAGQVSIRGHEIRSARLPNGLPVPVAAGDPVLFEGVGEEYISWTGGRLEGGGVRIGLSLVNLGAACKPGAPACWALQRTQLLQLLCLLHHQTNHL